MARRRFGSFGPALRQGQRRETAWIAGISSTAVTNLAANTGLFAGTLSASAQALRPFTVIRVRGELWVASDQEAADRVAFGAVGFSVVSDQAAAVGITALPGPITDEGSDLFFLHQFWLASVRVISAIGADFNDFRRYSLDSKAMRKINEDQDLAVTIDNQAAGAGVNFVLRTRILLKLH